MCGCSEQVAETRCKRAEFSAVLKEIRKSYLQVSVCFLNIGSSCAVELPGGTMLACE